MEDTEIIILLKKIVDEKMLDDISIMNAKMCIDALTYGGMGDIKNVRMLAINTIKRAGLIQINNTPNSFDVNKGDNKLLDKVSEIVEEIKGYLDTKDLNPDLATCLDFVIEDLTSEQVSQKQKLEAIQKYYSKYKPAITCADEYIAKSPNHGKH